MASIISSEIDSLPTFRTKSVATTMPTSLLSFETGNRLILLIDISRTASLSEASESTVMRDKYITSAILVFRGGFCTTRVTMSLSVIIPTGTSPLTTAEQHNCFELINCVDSKTVLTTLIETTSSIMTFLIFGVTGSRRKN
jgi:hypothetical protein